jgi:methionyl-tRNA synthetase
MLHALGFPDEAMPKFLVHGWWNVSGAKMSKSLGNVIDPDVLADKYGAEALRYYLMTDIVSGYDADFLEYRIAQRYNADLANSLGNLLNRTLSMAIRYCDGKLRRSLRPADTELRSQVKAYRDLADDVAMSGTMDMTIRIADAANSHIDETSPWKMMKEGRHEEVAGILYDLAERLRIIAILISPVLPTAAHGIFDQLNWKMELQRKEERFSLADAGWGKLPDGHVVGKPTPLFPRIELAPG